MKRISIQDLKAGLSGVIAEAEAGSTILITRHQDPVAQLGPPRPVHVHGGTRTGTGVIEPAIRRGTAGRYLDVLRDDRDGR